MTNILTNYSCFINSFLHYFTLLLWSFLYNRIVFFNFILLKANTHTLHSLFHSPSLSLFPFTRFLSLPLFLFSTSLSLSSSPSLTLYYISRHAPPHSHCSLSPHTLSFLDGNYVVILGTCFHFYILNMSSPSASFHLLQGTQQTPILSL